MPIIDLGGISRAAESPGFELNKYQQEILHLVEHSEANLQVEALAGSGKTATLELIAKALGSFRDSKRILMVAFNKEIADTLRARMPFWVQCQTLHSLGFAVCKDNLGYLKCSGWKDRNIFKSLLNMNDEEQTKFFWDNAKLISLMVGLWKGNLFELDDQDFAYNELANRYGLDIPESRFFNKIFDKVLAESCAFEPKRKGGKFISFDDMLYFPVVQDMNFPSYDIICVDEAQDLNKCQRVFLEKLSA